MCVRAQARLAEHNRTLVDAHASLEAEVQALRARCAQLEADIEANVPPPMPAAAEADIVDALAKAMDLMQQETISAASGSSSVSASVVGGGGGGGSGPGSRARTPAQGSIRRSPGAIAGADGKLTAAPGGGKSVSFESAEETSEREAMEAELEAERLAEAEAAELEASRPAWAKWSLESWVATMDVSGAISRGVTDLLLSSAGTSQALAGVDNAELQQLWMNFMQNLSSPDTLTAMLRQSRVVDAIGDEMWKSVQYLASDFALERVEQQAAQEERRERMARRRAEYERRAEERTAREEERTAREAAEAAAREEAAAAAREEEEAAAREEEAAEGVDEEEAAAAAGDDDQVIAARMARRREEQRAEMAKAEAEQEQVLEAERAAHEERLKAQREQQQRELRAMDAQGKWRRGKQLSRGALNVVRADMERASGVDAEVYNAAIAVDTDARKLTYGDSSLVFHGLARLLGRADAKPGEDEALLGHLQREHTEMADASRQYHPYEGKNNQQAASAAVTTSVIEWWVVLDPPRARPLIDEISADGYAHGLPLIGSDQASIVSAERLSTRGLPISHFKPRWKEINARLESELGASPLLLNGLVSLRLYTGPMFSKYNAALRGVQPPKAELQEALFAGADTDPRLAAQFELLCAGNRYVNTLHCVTAAIGKLSRLTRSTKVYRGPGGVVPQSFWESDAFGCKGGVELGLMSASKTKEEALKWVRRSRVKLLFEIHQSVAGRGAEVAWLSMYPNEDEVLFPPLCALEVARTRVEGRVLVVELRPGLPPAHLQEMSVEEMAEERRRELEREERAQESMRAHTRARVRWERSLHRYKSGLREARQLMTMQGLAHETRERIRARAEAEAEARALHAEVENQHALRRQATQEIEEILLAEMREKAQLEVRMLEEEEARAAAEVLAAQVATNALMSTKARRLVEALRKAVLQRRLKRAQAQLVRTKHERDAERKRLAVETRRLKDAHVGSLAAARERGKLNRAVIERDERLKHKEEELAHTIEEMKAEFEAKAEKELEKVLKKEKKKIEEEVVKRMEDKFSGQIKELREELGKTKTENLKLMGESALSK